MDARSVRLGDAVMRLAAEHLRNSTGALSWTGARHEPLFDPPLDAAERASLDKLYVLARQQLAMAPDTYDVVRAEMQSLRDARQMGRAAFLALSTAERDRLLYDALAATTRILLALLREDLD